MLNPGSSTYPHQFINFWTIFNLRNYGRFWAWMECEIDLFKIMLNGLLEINMFNVIRKVGRKAEILTKTTSHIYLCKFTYWSISESYRDHRHHLKNFANVSSFSAKPVKHVIKLAQRNWNYYFSRIDDPTFNIFLVALSKKR